MAKPAAAAPSAASKPVDTPVTLTNRPTARQRLEQKRAAKRAQQEVPSALAQQQQQQQAKEGRATAAAGPEVADTDAAASVEQHQRAKQMQAESGAVLQPGLHGAAATANQQHTKQQAKFIAAAEQVAAAADAGKVEAGRNATALTSGKNSRKKAPGKQAKQELQLEAARTPPAFAEPSALQSAVAAAEGMETLSSGAHQPMQQAVPAKEAQRKAKASAGVQGKGKDLPAIKTGLLASAQPAGSPQIKAGRPNQW